MFVVDRMDAKRPEPRSTLRKAALWGGIAVLPCIFVELGLQHLIDMLKLPVYVAALLRAFVVAAMVEELAKLICFRSTVWRLPEFDERFDGIVYATRAGLGFAAVENVLYLLGAKSLSGFAGMFIARGVFTVPMHAAAAAFMGYLAARRRFDGKGSGFLGGYLIAVLVHGAFDGGLMVAVAAAAAKQPLIALPCFVVPLAVVAISLLVLRRLSRRAIAEDDRAFAVAEPRVLSPDDATITLPPAV